jgi:hypothetical protein
MELQETTSLASLTGDAAERPLQAFDPVIFTSY